MLLFYGVDMRCIIRYIPGGMNIYRKAAGEAFIISKEAEDNH
jgi:hypothetical protein